MGEVWIINGRCLPCVEDDYCPDSCGCWCHDLCVCGDMSCPGDCDEAIEWGDADA